MSFWALPENVSPLQNAKTGINIVTRSYSQGQGERWRAKDTLCRSLSVHLNLQTMAPRHRVQARPHWHSTAGEGAVWGGIYWQIPVQQFQPWCLRNSSPCVPQCQAPTTADEVHQKDSDFPPIFLLVLLWPASGGLPWNELSLSDSTWGQGRPWPCRYPDNGAGADRVRSDGAGAGAATLLGILTTHSASPSSWAAHTHTHARTCFTRHWTHTSQTNYLTTLSPKEAGDHFKCSSLLVSHIHATAW